RLRVAQLGGLREQLCRVRLVHEDVVSVPLDVQETQLVRGLVVLRVRALGRAPHPLEPFAVLVREAHVAEQAREPEPRRRTRVVLARRRAVELHGFGVVLAAPPAELVAEARAVARLGMAVLARGDKEGKRAVPVLLALAEETARIPVAEV